MTTEDYGLCPECGDEVEGEVHACEDCQHCLKYCTCFDGVA